MGWAGSGDTRQQLQLRFPSKEAAVAYAAKYGIDAVVHEPRAAQLRDNFRTCKLAMRLRRTTSASASARVSAFCKIPPAICPPGSWVDVRVRQPGQVRKEAATTDGSGSPGSFFHTIVAMTFSGRAPTFARMGDFRRHVRRRASCERKARKPSRAPPSSRPRASRRCSAARRAPPAAPPPPTGRRRAKPRSPTACSPASTARRPSPS